MIVGGPKCAMASEDCQGRLERHHAFPKSRLKREFPRGAYRPMWSDEAWTAVDRYGIWRIPINTEMMSLGRILADPRNLIFLCQAHHERVTNHREYTDIPDSVYEFVDEFGLRQQLENDLARRVA